MSATTSPNWLHVLGLSEFPDGDWGRVRVAQINAVRQFALVRLVVGFLAPVAAYFALTGKVSRLNLFGWVGASIVSAALLALPQIRNREFPRLTASMGDLNKESASLVFASLIWAAGLWLFGPKAAPLDLLTLWALTAVLMGGVSFALSRAPLGAALFILITGGTLTWVMHHVGVAMITAISGVWTGALATSVLAAGREFALHSYAELTLKEKTEMVSLLLREHEDSGGDIIWQTDASRCLTHVSPRFAEVMGVQTDQLETKLILQILAGDKWEGGNFPSGLREFADKLMNRQPCSDLVVPVQINGETHWWEISAAPKVDDNGKFAGFRGVASDVSERHRSADKINRMARFDTLTGLPNRLQVTEALEHTLAEAEQWKRRCGMMMIDLDRFKAVNDTLGHLVGDRLLVQVAQRLNSVMTNNEMCGRLGGDEFAVVIRESKTNTDLEELAHRIISALSQPYEVDQHTLYIGASVGAAVSPRDGRTVETLIRSADLALYRSKDQGGGSYNVYEPQLHTHAEERRVLEIALRKALERNEFSLNYQPVVNARTGAVESFEALLRWNNAELGPISPAKFIPLAEEARLIRPIGEWALRTACMEAANWPSNIRIAVNVSAEQLLDSNYVSSVLSALSQAGLSPGRLELEVTESLFMSEGTTAIAVLDKILALGVRLALDDFGTGYSSLGYLSKTKFSTIKVDRSFVQGAAKNAPESIAIIRAVVALADSLGMMTTAEGVETESECEMIVNLGCRKIQGYLFGRPMPAKEARELANRGMVQQIAA